MADASSGCWVIRRTTSQRRKTASPPAPQAQGRDPWDLAYDLLLQREGREILYTPFANYADNNLDCCRDMILHENTVMGLGDGGAHVGTICDASFVTTLLTHWGRDRTRGDRIDLPTLVKNQAHDTARAVDLTIAACWYPA